MAIPVSELPRHPVPTVSVCVTTYNHEAFIAQALDGILMQEAAFPYEVIVGEDCSTDGTREIVTAYQRAHPDRIRTVLPDQNLGGGGKPLFAETLAHSRGAFIAFMDGDDFWTRPDKLQRQIEFLTSNPTHSMCFHEVDVIDGSTGATTGTYTGDIDEKLDIWGRCYIASCSPVFRREAILPLPAWYELLEFGDWPLYLVASTRGPIGRIDEVMGVYRTHPGGMWSKRDQLQRLESIINFYMDLTEHNETSDLVKINKYIFLNRYRLFSLHSGSGNTAEARRYATSCLSTLTDSHFVSPSKLIRMAMWALRNGLMARTPRHLP
jgi:glycosyltransferase involved in cell wall biosynthesis